MHCLVTFLKLLFGEVASLVWSMVDFWMIFVVAEADKKFVLFVVHV